MNQRSSFAPASISSRLKFASSRVGIPRSTGKVVRGFILFWIVIGPWPSAWVEKNWNPRHLDAASSAMVASGSGRPGRCLVGAAKVNLTDILSRKTASTQSIPLAGYGKRAHFKGNVGVDDPVHAKAIVIEQGENLFSIVSVDLLSVSSRLASRVMKRLSDLRFRLPRQQILFSATHTHSSYGSYGGKFSEAVSLGIPDEQICSALAEAIVLAIDQAWQTRVPADVSFASRDLRHEDLCNNRTEKNGETNEWLDVLSFRRSGRESGIAHVVIFSAHATCRSSKNFRVSGDYPAYLCQQVEDEVGGTCLFLAGGVGGMAPAGTDDPRETWSSRIGGTLARHAIEIIQDGPVPKNEVIVQAVGGQLPLPQPVHKINSSWRTSPILSGFMGQSSAWFQGMRINDCILIAYPADVGGILANRWRKSIPEVTTVAVSFNGDYVGYALPDEQYQLQSYEPASMIFHGPKTGQVFSEIASQLTRKLAYAAARNPPTF